MAAANPERRKVAATIAKIQGLNGPDDPRLPELRGRLAAVAAEEATDAHIAALVASAPALTPEQASRLRSLLPMPASVNDQG